MVIEAEDGRSCDDRHLLSTWLASRDEAALTTLLDRHRPTLQGSVRRIVRDHQAADDVVQETCIRLCDHADTITGSVGAWLHQTAHHLALSHIRSQARRRRREAEAGADSTPPDQPEAEPDAHLRALVVDCVNALTPAERDLIVRVFWDGRSQREMASEQRVSQVAIHKRVHAALGRLRQQLSRRGCSTSAAALAAVLASMAGGSLAAAENAWLTAAPPAGSRWLAGMGAAAGAGAGLALAGWLAWNQGAGPAEARDDGKGSEAPPAAHAGLPGPSRRSGTDGAVAAGGATAPLPDQPQARVGPGSGWTTSPGRDWGYWLIASPMGPERLQPDDAAGVVAIRSEDGGDTVILRPPAGTHMLIAIPLRHDPVDGVVVALEVGLAATPAVRDRRLLILAGAAPAPASLLYWASLAGDDPLAVPAGLPGPELKTLNDLDTQGYTLTVGDTGVRSHGLVPAGILHSAFPAREMGSLAVPLTVPAEGMALGRVRTRALGAAEVSTLRAALPPPPVLEQ